MMSIRRFKGWYKGQARGYVEMKLGHLSIVREFRLTLATDEPGCRGEQNRIKTLRTCLPNARPQASASTVQDVNVQQVWESTGDVACDQNAHIRQRPGPRNTA